MTDFETIYEATISVHLSQLARDTRRQAESAPPDQRAMLERIAARLQAESDARREAAGRPPGSA